MNIDTVYFKKDIVNSRDAFNELEKIRLKAKPTKKNLILDPSNIPPDMMNTIRNNNAFEDEFWRTHNKYKLTPHIDSKPKYTPTAGGGLAGNYAITNDNNGLPYLICAYSSHLEIGAGRMVNLIP